MFKLLETKVSNVYEAFIIELMGQEYSRKWVRAQIFHAHAMNLESILFRKLS